MKMVNLLGILLWLVVKRLLGDLNLLMWVRLLLFVLVVVKKLLFISRFWIAGHIRFGIVELLRMHHLAKISCVYRRRLRKKVLVLGWVFVIGLLVMGWICLKLIEKK